MSDPQNPKTGGLWARLFSVDAEDDTAVDQPEAPAPAAVPVVEDLTLGEDVEVPPTVPDLELEPEQPAPPAVPVPSAKPAEVPAKTSEVSKTSEIGRAHV